MTPVFSVRYAFELFLPFSLRTGDAFLRFLAAGSDSVSSLESESALAGRFMGGGASSSSESSLSELSLLGVISSAVGGGRALTAAGAGVAAGLGPRGFEFAFLS